MPGAGIRGWVFSADPASTASVGGPHAPDQTVLERVAAPAWSFSPKPRILIVLAHPDDEVLALGARLERFDESRMLTITDGAPRNGADARDHGFATLEEYRRSRRMEMLAAMADADLSEAVAPAFPRQVPDQEATLHMASLARAIAGEIRHFRPEAILTHPYEGGHPDHDACAFVVHAAVRLVQDSSLTIIEAPFYNAAANGSMRTGSFLPNATEERQIICPLNPDEQQRKRTRLACFSSQASTLAQFRVEEERFRVAPAYDFTKPPHEGKLLYEYFPWGMNGHQFRTLAAQAEELLGFTQETTQGSVVQAGHSSR